MSITEGAPNSFAVISFNVGSPQVTLAFEYLRLDGDRRRRSAGLFACGRAAG